MRIISSLIVAVICVCAFADFSFGQGCTSRSQSGGCSARQGLFARRQVVNVTVALPVKVMVQQAAPPVARAACSSAQATASCSSSSRVTIRERVRVFHR